MAVLGVNYDGGGYVGYDDETGEPIGELIPINYESIYLHTNKEKFIFNSGNFIVDWWNAIKKFYIELIETESFLSHSSSVDHFIMDGAPYYSAYAHPNGNELELKYVEENWIKDIESMVVAKQIYEGGIEIFVHDGTQPTFRELKEYVKLNS